MMAFTNGVKHVKEVLNPYHNVEKNPQVTTIVIDAGHGGKDTGCNGQHTHEKDIALSIALKLGKLIKINHPDVEVIYTRTEDKFIPLHRRIAIANENDADLFISIHCNYISNEEVNGTETFVMGLHRAEENLETAKRENKSILLEQNYEHVYEGYDPNSNEGHIILSLYQNAFLDYSLHFASNVEEALSSNDHIKSRGVKQAGFVVLRRATMPSVLIETGFLSNPEEEHFLSQPEGQQKIAQSILKAFSAYKQAMESIALPDPTSQLVAADDRKSQNNLDNEAVHKESDKQVDVRFSVQLAAFTHKIEDIPSSPFRNVSDLSIIEAGKLFKYYCGSYMERTAAEKRRDSLRNEGFPGAFVVTLTK